MPLYGLTFKDEEGKTSQVELNAPNLPELFRLQTDIFHLIRIERINRKEKTDPA